MKTFKKALTASAVAVAMAAPMAANATNGILPLGNGMTAHGFGGAGIANAGDVMAGVDNPALVSRTPNQKGVGVSIFSPIRTATLPLAPGGVDIDSENDYFLIPQGGYTADNWGVLVYAMGGMNTEYNLPSAYGGGTVGIDLMGLVIAPTYSQKIDDKTSWGASLLVGYEALEFTNDAPAFSAGPFAMPPSADDSATGFGFKLGVVHDIDKDTSVGFTYQSEIKMAEMDEYCNGLFYFASDCKLNMPSQIGVGMSTQITPSLKFVGDIIRVNWSSVAVFDEVFGWEDQTIFKFGVEYKANDTTVYRFGVNHGESPIPDEAMMVNWLAPAITEDHLVFGVGKDMGNGTTINGYFAYVLNNEQSTATPFGDIGANMDQFALGVGWNWKY